MPPPLATAARSNDRSRSMSGATGDTRVAAAATNGGSAAQFAPGVSSSDSGTNGNANGSWSRAISLLPESATTEVPGVDTPSLLAAIRARSSGVSDMQRRVHERNVLYLAQCVAYATTNHQFAADMANTVKVVGAGSKMAAFADPAAGPVTNGASADHAERKARGNSASGAESTGNGTESGSQSGTPTSAAGRHLCPCCSKMQKDARLKYFYGATVRVCESEWAAAAAAAAAGLPLLCLV